MPDAPTAQPTAENPYQVEVPASETGPGLDLQPEKEGQDQGADHLYAGKFKTPEDMEKAYKELQSRFGKLNQKPEDAEDKAPEQEKPEDKKTEENVSPAYKQVGDVLSKSGIDITKLSAEFDADGKLSDASYAALAKAGYGREMVDQTISSMLGATASQTVIAEAQIAEVTASVGGNEGYGKLMKWASTNLTPTEQKRYNAVMEKGDLDTIKLTVAGLKARYDATYGVDPALIGGHSQGAPDKDVFMSTDQVVRAMADPRYGKDTAYTKEVEQKLGRSNVF